MTDGGLAFYEKCDSWILRDFRKRETPWASSVREESAARAGTAEEKAAGCHWIRYWFEWIRAIVGAKSIKEWYLFERERWVIKDAEKYVWTTVQWRQGGKRWMGVTRSSRRDWDKGEVIVCVRGSYGNSKVIFCREKQMCARARVLRRERRRERAKAASNESFSRDGEMMKKFPLLWSGARAYVWSTVKSVCICICCETREKPQRSR